MNERTNEYGIRMRYIKYTSQRHSIASEYYFLNKDVTHSVSSQVRLWNIAGGKSSIWLLSKNLRD